MQYEEFIGYINSDIFFAKVIHTTIYKKKYTVDDIYNLLYEYYGDSQAKSDIKKTIKRNILKMNDIQNFQSKKVTDYVMKCNKRIETNICNMFNISQKIKSITYKNSNQYSIMELYCIVVLVSDTGILKVGVEGNKNRERSLEKIKNSSDMIGNYLHYIQNQIVENIYEIVSKRDLAVAFWLKALIKAGLEYKTSLDEGKTFGSILLEVQKAMKEYYKKECIHIAKKDKSIDGKTGGKKLTQKEMDQVEANVNDITKYFLEININNEDYNKNALQIMYDLEDVFDLINYLSSSISFELIDLITQISSIKIDYDTVEVDYEIFEIKNEISAIQQYNEGLLERISCKANQVQLLYCRLVLNELKQKLLGIDSIVNPKKGETSRKEIQIILKDNNIE